MRHAGEATFPTIRTRAVGLFHRNTIYPLLITVELGFAAPQYAGLSGSDSGAGTSRSPRCKANAADAAKRPSPPPKGEHPMLSNVA
jgi:hypothetical protein